MLIGALSDDNAALLYDTAELYHVESLSDAAFRYIWTVRHLCHGFTEHDLLRLPEQRQAWTTN